MTLELTAAQAELARALAPRLTRYIPHTPTVPQMAFLWLPQREAFYGGAAGGGKSDALLMGALQWVDQPTYVALILRRSFKELAKPGAIMDRAHSWLRGTDARWNDDEHSFTFPSGAVVTFGYIEQFKDVYQYDGPEYQYIAWDELTAWENDKAYVYMFSRMRKLKESPVPSRMRSAGNPGGPGHEWVKQRFITPDARGRGRIFIPAKKEDNPYLDLDDYNLSLSELDPVTYAQKAEGDWDVGATGDLFDVTRLVPLPAVPTAGIWGRGRGWDKAGTDAATKRAKYAKYTVGLRMSRVSKALYGVEYVVEDLIRGQWAAGVRDRVIREATGLCHADEPASARIVLRPDPPDVPIYIEREPGSGGQQSADITVSDLAGRIVIVDTPHVDKETRARMWAAQVNAGNCGVVVAPWNAHLRAVLAAAPNGVYWDEIDAGSMVFNHLALLAVAARPASAPGQRRALPAGYRA